MTAKVHAMIKSISRPYPARLIKDAQKIAAEYQVILQREDGRWFGRGLELPHVIGEGKTADRCFADTQQALCAAVAILLEQGRRPPAPAWHGARTETVEVRMTTVEKAALENTAKGRGFKELADFLRETALREIG
jgi:predicted RNase H-like HicB family nuclease